MVYILCGGIFVPYVLICAAGIALCCLVGAAVGFLLRRIPPKVGDGVTAAAAGVMLYAAVLGLAEPAIRYARLPCVTLTAGILGGALFLIRLERVSPALGRAMGMKNGGSAGAVLFVAAMAIHHFPEGIAAGVSFGTESLREIVSVTTGIELQNVPECMMLVPPLLLHGSTKKRAAAVAAVSAAVEVLGLFAGYFAIRLSRAILPFALAFAAGSMLFVIVDEMLPPTHAHGNGRTASLCVLAGFCLMLCLSLFTD